MEINHPDAQEKRVNIIAELNNADKEQRYNLSRKKGFGTENKKRLLIGAIAFLASYILYLFFFHDFLYDFIADNFVMSSIADTVFYLMLNIIEYVLFAGTTVKTIRFGFCSSTKKHFEGKNEKMIVGFGKEDIMIRSECACVKLPYSSIKKARGFKEGLFIYFVTSQRVYIPWRFFGEQSFSYVTNCLNSAIRRRFSIAPEITLQKDPQTVVPEEFFTANGSPKTEIQYCCEKQDYYNYFYSVLKRKNVSFRHFLYYNLFLVAILIISCLITKDILFFIMEFISFNALFLISMLIISLQNINEAKRRSNDMYKYTNGAQRMSMFDNCVLNEHENGTWHILSYEDDLLCLNDEKSCVIYGSSGGIFIPIRYAEPYLEELYKLNDFGFSKEECTCHCEHHA